VPVGQVEGHYPDDQGQGAPLPQGVDPEAAEAGNGEGKVVVPGIQQLGHIPARQGVELLSQRQGLGGKELLPLPAQAAVVVGGTALSGGKGGVRNTLVGVLIMTVLENGLTMVGVNPNIRTGIQGVIILISVILTAARGAKVISK